MRTQKNGPGITKAQAADRNYFDILTRHFGDICKASLWYALANILFFAATYVLAKAYFTQDNLVKIVTGFLSGKVILLPIVPFLPLMLTGPFTAGLTFVTRNFAKEEHTFIRSDLFEHAKKNLGYALLTSVLQALVAYLLLQALIVYNSFFLANGLPTVVLYTLLAVVTCLLVIMSYYIYPIMVTFRMNYKTILKNAWTFTILKLPQNLFFFVILVAINFGAFYLCNFVIYMPFLWFLLMCVFLTGFTSYTANYYIWHVLNKYIVQYVTKKEKEESVFSDDPWDAFDKANGGDNWETFGEVSDEDPSI